MALLFALAACGRDEPAPEKLPLPPEAIARHRAGGHELPPPPMPPWPPGPVDPPASVKAALAGYASSEHAWPVTLTEVATSMKFEVPAELANELIHRLLLRDSWWGGAHGCSSDGTEIRVDLGDRGPPLVMWTNCGDVEIGPLDADDPESAAWSTEMNRWFTELCTGLGLKHQ